MSDRAVPTIFSLGSIRPSASSANSDGSSIRRDRSPVAPNSSRRSAMNPVMRSSSPSSSVAAEIVRDRNADLQTYRISLLDGVDQFFAYRRIAVATQVGVVGRFRNRIIVERRRGNRIGPAQLGKRLLD